MAPLEGNAAAEAISAFNNLGYQPAQVSQAVAAAMKELGEEADMAKLIRRGLRELARYKQRHPLIFIDHCDLLTS